MHTNHVGTTVLGGPNVRRTVGDAGPYNAYINRVGEDLCVLPRNIPIISQRLRVDSEVDPSFVCGQKRLFLIGIRFLRNG